MFPSSKEQGGSRRRNRIYSNDSTVTRSSSLSLASNNTGTSNTSTSSVATVTPDAYLTSRQDMEVNRKSRRSSGHSIGMGMDASTMDVIGTENAPDVFEFLVEENPVETSNIATQNKDIDPASENKPSITLLAETSTPSVDSGPDPEEYYRSLLSDSGISVGSGTSEFHIAEPHIKQYLSPVTEESYEHSSYAPSVADTYYHDAAMWNHYVPAFYSHTPEPMPLSPISIRSHAYPQDYAYRGTPEPPSTGESSISCLNSTPLVFRNKQSLQRANPQLFRSFAKLNARILLQMQSNISELEHELGVLDAKACPSDASPRSKKSEHYYSRHQARDQPRRAELYQELHTSLKQYYESLVSFRQVVQIGAPAVESDTLAFKTWLQSHVYPASRAITLMGDASDLIQLGGSSNDSSDQTLRIIAYGSFTNIFVPLILFKVTSSVLSRLIVLSLTTTIAALIMERHRINMKKELGDLYWHCILGCAIISLVAALFF